MGNFTLPGEAGYEALTLELAERWGADAIRDSDGTVLSEAITNTGYDIYSTICPVRSDNEWAKKNRDKLQQSFLMSRPVTATGPSVSIDLLDGFFREQFSVNSNDTPEEWWQVFDRSAGTEVPASRWRFDKAKGSVLITGATPWHRYTVNFLAYTVWEAISMYNHVTNNWGDREHLMPVDPYYPETQRSIVDFLGRWLVAHPRTKIVRFTSLFYNFAWFWGDASRQRYIYSDWGGYEHTVSPAALRDFQKEKGYRLRSEDFVNNGAYLGSHNVPSPRYRDWMDFMNRFVTRFGRELIDLVHKAGKSAYMFYDDHWIGTEPYGERFKDLGFDGIIKCVFNGFEVRLCAGVSGARRKELRLHPYLFPTGLAGEPTFMEGGDPAADCRRFWKNIRRALLRVPIQRIGLGGYLHLVQGFPDFVDAVTEITREFNTLRRLHESGAPLPAGFSVAVLSAWGRQRSWICNGHFIRGLVLNELTESLAGLPFDVEFLGFDDILEKGIPKQVRVIINAGDAGSAWSGGDCWKDPRIAAVLSEWVSRGNGFLGIGEPSAVFNEGDYFRLSDVLGLDRETGRTLSVEKVKYAAAAAHFITGDAGGNPDFGKDTDRIFVTGPRTVVLADRGNSPVIAVNLYGVGRSVYFSGFRYSAPNTRLLHRSLYWAAGMEKDFGSWTCDHPDTECAWFPKSRKIVVINNSDEPRKTIVHDADNHPLPLDLPSGGMVVLDR